MIYASEAVQMAYGSYFYFQMDDPIHLEKFNHDFAKDVRVNVVDLRGMSPQDMDYFLVLDLEGKVEILEFPVLLMDAKTLDVVDLFHRYCSV